MICEPHYYKGKTHYDRVIPWYHSWAHKLIKPICGHSDCKRPNHRVSFNGWRLDLYHKRDRDMYLEDEDFEQYIIMQECKKHEKSHY